MTTGLDPLLVLCQPLQDIFLDKDFGVPLAGGRVEFYIDGTTTPIPVYEISGTAPYSDASYIVLNNPLILSSIGTFVDNSGNDIIPYLFPYKGVPGNTNGEVELYQINVYSAAGVFQFSRIAWPNTIAIGSDADSNTLINYIPNGQFWLHNDNPPAPTVVSTRSISYIAQGGWTFETVNGSSATNILSFLRIDSASDYPDPNQSADPRYYVQVECTHTDNSDQFKDLCIAFPDVNKFSSDANVNNYTLSFQAQSLSGSNVNVEIFIIKNYGAGGSTATSQTFSLGGSSIIPITTSAVATPYNLPGYFGTNNGFNIGDGDDDSVQIVIRFPLTTTFKVILTDFLLTPGNIAVTGFPQTPNDLFLSQSTAGWLPQPKPDGSDLYLPVMLTPQGMTYDHSNVALISSAFYSTTTGPKLFCDGTAYVYDNYSTLGIPYSRLGSILISNSAVANTPMFGTGAKFSTMYPIAGNASLAYMAINSPGLITAATGGNTAFTVTNVSTGAASINFFAYPWASGVTVVGNFPTAQFASGQQQSLPGGFTVGDNSSYIGITAQNVYSWGFIATAASAPIVGGNYFTFSNATSAFCLWFTVDGAGAQPTPPASVPPLTYNFIPVHILSTYTALDVENACVNAINSCYSFYYTITGVPTDQQYLTFVTNPATPVANYFIWFQVNSSSVAPVGPAGTGIKVVLTGSENTSQIASAILVAVNKYQYAVPDMRGAFMRGLDVAGLYDKDIASRWSVVLGMGGPHLGTFEYQQFLSHRHRASEASPTPQNSSFTQHVRTNVDPFGASQVLGTTDDVNEHQYISGAVTPSGGSETRPINVAVNYFINY